MRPSSGVLAAVVLLTTTALGHAQPIGCACSPVARPAFTAERFGIFSGTSVPRPHRLIDDVLQVAARAKGRATIANAVGHDQAAMRTELAGALLPLFAAERGRGSARPSRPLSAAVPEPADWMLLVCGLAVGVFIARRKASWAAH